MRRPLVAANWKMHGTRVRVAQLLAELRQVEPYANNIDVLLLPPYVFL